MKRSELRRISKEKAKTATYNLTEAQLDAMVKERVDAEFAKREKQLEENSVNTAMILLLTLPLEVLMDHYWPKSYAKKIPEFTNYVLEYYRMYENGEIDMDKLQEDLWVYGGVRLEKTK